MNSLQHMKTEWKLGLAAGLVAILFLSYWVHLEHSFADDRASARVAGELRATQLSEVVRQSFETTFHSISFVLDEVAEDHLEQLGQFDVAARHALALLPAPTPVSVGLYDINGVLVTATADDERDIAERAYFKKMKAQHGDSVSILIGEPMRDPRTGVWALPFARGIWRSGQLAGVLVIRVPAAYFAARLEEIGLEPHDSAQLIAVPSGLVLIGSMHGLSQIGTLAPSQSPFLAPLAPESGVIELREASDDDGDGDRHLVAWSRMPVYDAAVVVSLSENDLLTAVNDNIAEDRRYFLVNTLLILALLGVVAALVLRAVRQRHALAAQEALYHELFEQNRSIKLISDPQTGQILSANQAACSFYGYSREQLLQMKITQINCLPPHEVKACMAEALRADRPFFLFPHRLASGEIRKVEVYSGPVVLGGHAVLYSIIHDVTDRFELEERLKANEQRYRTMFEVMPAGIVMVNGQGEIDGFNSAALEILVTDAEALRQREKPLFDPSGRRIDVAERPSMRALTTDLNHELFYVESADGQRIWATFNSRRLPDKADGTPQGAVIAFSNITEIMRQEEKLLISQLVFDSTTEGIMVTDPTGRLMAVNRAFTQITGYTAAEGLGRHASFLASGEHDEAFFRAFYESLATKGSWEGEIVNRHKDGHHFVERLVINAVIRGNGLRSGYVGIFSDITARKEKERELWRQANFDALTGLPNRTLFLDRAEQSLAQAARRRQPVGILFIDLDRFKPVNDRYGHSVGDDLLKAVAARISSCLRTEDSVGRLGGDEFVALLPIIANRAGAVTVADKVLAALHEPFLIGGRIISIGACVGVAVAENGEGTAADLLKSADGAMYQAKEAGRGRVAIAA